MYLGVQPNLVERVVFESARCRPELRDQYERQFADCYNHRDPAQRDQAFAALHERWFRELGYYELLTAQAAMFPFVSEKIGRLMVTQAPGARDQTVELFGSPGRYTVVMAVAAAVMLDAPAFEYWARHELQHVDDMLNPAFGFDLTQRLTGSTHAGRSLTRDRYAVLWAISVDSRLEAVGRMPGDIRNRRGRELTRAFGLNDSEVTSRAFDAYWQRCQEAPPTHTTMLEWAEQGLPGIDSGVGESRRCRDGLLCPLCRFPTFDWCEDPGDDGDLARSVRVDFPAWQGEQGLCKRCEEIYRACVPAQVTAG